MKKIILLVCFSITYGGLLGWTWPLSNSNTPDIFTSAFGPRDKEDTQGLQYDFHKGMDLQATAPEEVYAAYPGYATRHYDETSGHYIKIG